MSAPPARDRRIHPWVAGVLALGAALSLAQQATLPGEVFFSGDGGIKSLLAKQFARGEWRADLHLPAEPWIEALWRDGLYPFGQPFAIRAGDGWIVSFAPPFMALSAPFYRAFGFRGFTLPPLLALWAVWGVTAWWLRRLGLSPAARTAGLFGLVFASFLTPYGATYWEHTLAVALSWTGACLALPTPAGAPGRARALAGGSLLGLAIAARPESAAFAVGMLAALGVLRVPGAAFAAAAGGVALGGGAFALLNFVLYGDPVGVVGMREMEALHVPYIYGLEALRIHAARSLWLCPIGALAAAVALAGRRVPALRASPLEAALWLVIGVTAVGAAFLSRHSGGDQIGARYWLHALPPLFASIALQWSAFGALSLPWRRGLRLAVIALLAWGVWANAVGGTRALAANYRERIWPALVSLRADPNAVVAVEHQWMAQELAAAFDSKTFFRIRTQADVDTLMRALVVRGIDRLTLVSYREEPARIYRGDGFELSLDPRGQFGSVFLVDGRVAPAP